MDFVGHLGGDDFMLVMRSTDWRERLAKVFRDLDAAIPDFYSAEHRQVGGVVAGDCERGARPFPIMTLSIGAVVSGERFTDASQMAACLQLAKRRAKAKTGHALFVDNGQCVVALDIQHLS